MTKAKGPIHFRIHHLLGLFLGTFMGIVCLTGTIAVVSHEIEWLVAPETRASPGQPDTSLGQRWDAARQARPDLILTSVSRTGTESAVENYFATELRATDANGAQLRIHVDPVGGEVRGTSHGVSFPSFMRGLHYYLFDVTGAGFYVVGILGPVLLAMMITGLRMYRGWRKGFTKMPRTNQRPRSWWGSLHRLLGVWSLLFIPIIAITVIWYLLEWDGLLKWETYAPQTDAQVLTDIRSVTGEDIDRWVTITENEIPGITVENIWLPWNEGEAVTITGRAGDRLVRERANSVAIDPVSDDVLSVTKAASMGWKQRWTHTADPLHFGGFGGIWTKLVWFLSGLVLTALCFSGVTIYCLRKPTQPKP